MQTKPETSTDKVAAPAQASQNTLATVSKVLRSNKALTVSLYALCAIGLIIEPILAVNGLVRMNHASRIYPYYGILLWTAILAITFFHELNSPWMSKLDDALKGFIRIFRYSFSIPTKDQNLYEPSADLSTLASFGRSIAHSKFTLGVLAYSIAVPLLKCVAETTVAKPEQSVITLIALISCVGISWIFPALSIAAILLFRALVPPSTRRTDPTAKSVNSILTTRGAYLGGYFCFLSLLYTACFSNFGMCIANWLIKSMMDANITDGRVFAGFHYMVSGIITAFVFLAFNPLAVRICSGFQVLVNRVCIAGENLLDALIDTANVQSKSVKLPEHFVAARNISGALLWVTGCYLTLFWLTAACPMPLGYSILNWLDASTLDAHFHESISPNNNLNYRLFLASIVAAYGAVPVAVMSCAFLPPRKHRSLIISRIGVLCPNSAGNLLGFSPLKHWSNLKKVELSGGCGRSAQYKTLKLSFGRFDSVAININQVDPSELSELLAAADEHAPHCKFDSSAIALRLRLLEETKANSLIETKKFASTIFSPKNAGDFLSDNRYRIVRKLSGKPLSAVYLARDNVKHERVVLKEYVLPSSALNRERMLENFDREYELLSTLKDSSVAQVKDRFESDDGTRYLVMEFVEGADLRKMVERKGPRSERKVTRWCLEICEIMTVLHNQNPPVVHRDLTPDNLMEDADGNLKLIDFGAAHQMLEGVTGTLIGKQCYIAPEQLRGKATVKSDIYSFGCTLYYLLTAKDPVALRQCVFDSTSRVSSKLQNLIRACTEFDEDDRPDSFTTIQKYLCLETSEPLIQHYQSQIENEHDLVSSKTAGESQ